MKDHLAGATPEQVRRLYDVLTGKVPTCPECSGVVIYADDVDLWYCVDSACLWNQDLLTRTLNARYNSK